MAPRRPPGHLALFVALCLPGVAAVIGRAMSEAAANLGAAEAAIPEWTVNSVLAPLQASAPPPDTVENATTAAEEEQLEQAPEVLWKRVEEPIGTSQAQDAQRCPVLKLPDSMWLLSQVSAWSGQSGVWQKQGGGNIVFGRWDQSFWSKNWADITVRSSAGYVAVVLSPMTKEQLQREYHWEVQKPAMAYPNISKLEAPRFRAMYHNIMGKWPPANVTILPDTRRKPYAVLDCEGELLFVVSLRDNVIGDDHYLAQAGITEGDKPGGIDIFDRNGGLAAHAIADIDKPRFQFVDANGYLLATAQAPALDSDVAMKDVPRSPEKGNIMGYEIHFEDSGYVGGSRLLEQSFRYVLAGAMQARAIHDAGDEWMAPFPSIRMALHVGAAVTSVVLVCLISACIYYSRRPAEQGKSLAEAWMGKGV